ncbi:hypothetical protein [Persicitalea sp.]|uniref:hypothetical protein n=1 Tax=Persicitalea sp. TaxID=3100273 RepID=UPI0035937683
MDLNQLKSRYDVLATRQLIVAEGIKDMEEIERTLFSDAASAQSWGNFAVVIQAALVPLNVIVNAFEVKKATSIYQSIVKTLYSQYAASGSRNSKPTKEIFKVLGGVITDHLKSQALTEYIPGVNILLGFAQDSIAFFNTAVEVSNNSKEQSILFTNMRLQMDKAKKEMLKLGTERAIIHDRLTQINRTA